MTPESPHLGEIKRMRKQCVPGASPFFARAGDKVRITGLLQFTYSMRLLHEIAHGHGSQLDMCLTFLSA